MRSPKDISDDGFTATDLSKRHDLTLISANLALRSYCATTNALRGRLHVTEPCKDDEDQKTHDFNLGSNYRRLAFQAIVHFQHFAELVVQQALRDDHPLLVVLTGSRHEHLHRLLHGDPVDPNHARTINTIEFSEALERCCTLLQSGRLKANGYDFIRDSQKFLSTVNRLRNRLWHRGTYVLRYRALDELIGGYGLPFLRQAVGHPRLAGRERAWRYQPLTCKLDPLFLIEAEVASQGWCVKKVAFLKELARAAYENPLIDIEGGWFDSENAAIRARAESSTEFPDSDVHEVTDCPVCGVKLHVVYRSWADGFDDRPVDFTYKSHCLCCGLELYSEYGNPSDHGLTGIPDLWKVL